MFKFQFHNFSFFRRPFRLPSDISSPCHPAQAGIFSAVHGYLPRKGSLKKQIRRFQAAPTAAAIQPRFPPARE
ncbi:hypothetical protein HMPREF9120_01866, partial [Neisseria sp. oral taxon 020 str. F0370]